VRNDAVENLLGALTIAGHFIIPEVTLYFNNKLLRGNRALKKDAVDLDAFDSPNMKPLVKVGINIGSLLFAQKIFETCTESMMSYIEVSWPDVQKPRAISKFRAHKNLEPNVAAVRLFPGISAATIRAFLSEPIKGVVLETFGAGNAPGNQMDILNAIREATERGVIVVNCTQVTDRCFLSIILFTSSYCSVSKAMYRTSTKLARY
jgi:lysophospholipase